MSADIDVVSAREKFAALSRENRDEFVPFSELVSSSTHEAEIVNPYRVVKDKGELVGIPFFVRTVDFRAADGSEYDSDYCILYAVTERNEMVILTDGGTGIYAYMKRAVEKRIEQGDAEAYDGFLFPNGLTRSDYRVDKNGAIVPDGTKDSTKATTFYFA
jgi:hypothetical protein